MYAHVCAAPPSRGSPPRAQGPGLGAGGQAAHQAPEGVGDGLGVQAHLLGAGQALGAPEPLARPQRLRQVLADHVAVRLLQRLLPGRAGRAGGQGASGPPRRSPPAHTPPSTCAREGTTRSRWPAKATALSMRGRSASCVSQALVHRSLKSGWGGPGVHPLRPPGRWRPPNPTPPRPPTPGAIAAPDSRAGEAREAHGGTLGVAPAPLSTQRPRSPIAVMPLGLPQGLGVEPAARSRWARDLVSFFFI